MHWTFDIGLMNIIKYRVMKLKQSIDVKIKNSKDDKFVCKNCSKEFDQMEVYTKNYKCPFDDSPLEKKEKSCSNPEALRRESNRIFSSFESAIKALDYNYTIPREFFGFELIK